MKSKTLNRRRLVLWMLASAALLFFAALQIQRSASGDARYFGLVGMVLALGCVYLAFRAEQVLEQKRALARVVLAGASLWLLAAFAVSVRLRSSAEVAMLTTTVIALVVSIYVSRRIRLAPRS